MSEPLQSIIDDDIDKVDDVDDVIEALGGTFATAALTGYKPTAVSNWRKRQQFPSNTFLVFARVLRENGLSAPARLWGMREPAQT